MDTFTPEENYLSLKQYAENYPYDINYIREGDATILMKAADAGYLDIVKYLFNKGAEINIVDRIDMTALLYASMAGHTEVVQFLLEMGANVNHVCIYGNTALTRAAMKPKLFKILIHYGADVNHKNNLRTSSLLWATFGGHFQIVKLLVKAGAELNDDDFFIAPLVDAVFKGHTDIVKYLVKKGADANKPDQFGESPLAMAKSLGLHEMVQILCTKV